MRARHAPPFAAALLLAALAVGVAPAVAQGGGQGGQGGGAGGETTGGDTGTGASGSTGTTGDLGTNRGRRSTSDVEDPGGGTSGAMPDTDAEGARPVVALPRERVRRVQERLSAEGFDAGPADGRMGERTRTALRDFQRSRGLDPTGEPNGPTLTELGVE